MKTKDLLYAFKYKHSIKIFAYLTILIIIILKMNERFIIGDNYSGE